MVHKKIIDTIKVKAGLSCVNLLQNTFTNKVLSQCSISSLIQREDAGYQVMSEFEEIRKQTGAPSRLLRFSLFTGNVLKFQTFYSWSVQ